MKPVDVGPFLGINNRLPDFSLHVPKQGDFLRDAVNVDIDNAGRLRSRVAPQRVQDLSGAHSIYKNYYVQSGVLYRYTLGPFAATPVKILSNNDPMFYAEFNGDIYLSNGVDAGRVAATGIYYPWAMPLPGTPSVSSVAGGSLLPGAYQVAVSFRNAVTGEESGVGPSTNHDLATGTLRVTMPAIPEGATHVDLYVSTVNGSIPFLQSTHPGGTTLVDITTLAAGREANQRYEEPLPPGRPAVFNQTLYVISGNDLYEGIPGKLGYYQPMNSSDASGGRIPFDDAVTNFVPAQLGAYVTTSKMTYFFSGTLVSKADIVSDVLPYGAVPGTAFEHPFEPRVGWFGDKGFVIADTNGGVEQAMVDAVDLVAPASGFATVMTSGGYIRVVSCGWCLNIKNKAVTRYDGWDFTSSSAGYATRADGIYSLDGDGPVAWSVDFGKQNFGDGALTSLIGAYFGAASSDVLTLRVSLPDGIFYDYPTRSYSADLTVKRADTGLGLLASWFGLSVFATSDLTLASAGFLPKPTSRRI